MGKLFINATKNFGSKIDEAIVDSKGRIDGIHYSIADVPVSQIWRLDIESVSCFPEFPIYYLTVDNEYLSYYFDREPVELEYEKRFIPSEKNNRLICMGEHVDFSFLENLPLSTLEYTAKREHILNMINKFYDDYYRSNYLMTPTFIMNKIGSWEEIMLLDVLKNTQNYLVNKPKKNVFLSIILDPVLLDTSDVVSNIKNYIKMYSYVNGLSLTIINDNSMYRYTKDEYKNILSFIKELKSLDLKVYLQYCGIKDVIFSVLATDRYSVGWFGSYRNFDTTSKKISEIESSSFGRRVKKILSENFMSEIPLEYLSVLTAEECKQYFGLDKDNIDMIDYKKLEQKYWKTILKIIQKDDNVEFKYKDDELIYYRCESLKRRMLGAEKNLCFMIKRLRSEGRFSDATKLEKNNLEHVKMYTLALGEFQEKLFF